MPSEYDILYVLATRGEMRMNELLDALKKKKSYYSYLHKKVIRLEKQGYIRRKGKIKIIENEKTTNLLRLIFFCIKNSINYNVLFDEPILNFLEKASKKEFFTRQDTPMHGQTFNYYTTALQKYGFLLIVSRKPLKCKLLEHHFLSSLLKFFGKNPKFYTSKKHAFMPLIRKEMEKYKRNLKIAKIAIEEAEEKEKIKFIHSSLSLEGNPVTLSDTQRIIIKQIVPKNYRLIDIQEVTNYKKAVELMIENAREEIKLDLPLILKYHKLGMAHIHGAGEIRKQNVRIKGNPDFKTCEWRLLLEKLNQLMKTYDEFYRRKKDVGKVIGFASFFHNEFQRIHPFIDGNSRTSRLLMLHILRSYNIPVLNFPLGYFDLYMNLTKKSKQRDDQSFQHLIEEIVFFNLKKMNSLL